jgi:uncharacterized protein (TIGR03435 family)
MRPQFSLRCLLAAVLVATPLCAVAAAQPPTAAAPAPTTADLTGSWQGTIALPANAPPTAKAPRMLIKVTRDGAQGAPYKGTVYLLGPRAMAAPAILVHGSEVSFALPLIGNGMTYVGTLSADGKTMIGGLKPPNGAGPGIGLNLTHVAEEDAWAVPEAPTPMAKDAHPKFEVVTVKPHAPNGRRQLGPDGHEFKQLGYTVDAMIGLAYAMHVDQIIGAPDWFKTEEWDIEGVPDTPGHPNSPQSEDLTHDVLATRFGMKFHYEQRELSAYVITVAKGGPKLELTASATGADPNTGLGFGNATLQNMTIANFAKWFQTYVLDRPVIDRTGLTGRYDFTLKWAPDETQFQQGREPGAPRPPLSDEIAARPAIKDAMLQQLGLKMEVMKTMVPVMVIDHAERPSAN